MVYGMCLSFFVLKIFLQPIFVCPINLLKFCKFSSSNHTGCLGRLWDQVNSIFKSEENLTFGFLTFGFLRFGIFQGYHHMAKLLVKSHMLSLK